MLLFGFWYVVPLFIPRVISTFLKGEIDLKITYYWISVVVLLIATILLFSKGMDLRSIGTDVDGIGIGVYFLFYEINDQVPTQNIPTYAFGFFTASIITALATTIMVWGKWKVSKQ